MAQEDHKDVLREKDEFLATEEAKIADPLTRFAVQKEREAIAEKLGASTRRQPILWNVPQRNPWFTGREDVLAELHKALTDDGRAVLGQAISGLGGIGKTQTAVEYCHRHRDDYSPVFWVRAETDADARAGFAEVARLLALPEADASDQNAAVEAVRCWLATKDGWLVVFDNADRPELLKPLLPVDVRGKILLTSRANDFAVLNIRTPFRIPTLPPTEALTFLLERTERERASNDERQAAQELAHELGGLALALEQAAAFIKANQGRFRTYLESYRERHLQLLEEAWPKTGDYPSSIAATWSINFQEVDVASQASIDLLNACAFLAPDAIPLEIFEEAGGKISPALELNGDKLALGRALEPLLRFSLLERDVEERTVSVHRMVQAVTLARLGAEEEPWAERVVAALNDIHPRLAPFETWTLCQRLAGQVRAAERFLVGTGDAASLLNGAGIYEWYRGSYAAAERFLDRAITIREELLGDEHFPLIQSLGNLANLYFYQDRLEDAEPLYERVLAISLNTFGDQSPEVALALNNMANLYNAQGRLEDAERFCAQALTIRKKVFGLEHSETATSLQNLGAVYFNQGRLKDAEIFFDKALATFKKIHDDEHPQIASSLYHLALLYDAQGRKRDATPLYERALGMREKLLGDEHPDVAPVLNDLALSYDAQGRTKDSEQLYQRAIAIYEKVHEGKHRLMVIPLIHLARLYSDRDRLEDAVRFYNRALSIGEKTLGSKHHLVVNSLNNLAIIYLNQNRMEDAEPLLNRALAVHEGSQGSEGGYPTVTLAMLRHRQDRLEEAEDLFRRGIEIFESALGPGSPEAVEARGHYADFLREIGRPEDAERIEDLS